MKREYLIKQMNDALQLQEQMKKDKNLRYVYYDVDLDKFIDRCREILSEEFYEPVGLVIPF
ncbi:MAG: hypothetical protein QXI16_07780 [Sulfolobaceae archaeon]